MRKNSLKSVVYPCLFVILFFTVNAAALFAEEKLVGKTVNVNTATAEEFVNNVSLITPELAEKIVQYRDEAGDFQTIEELLQVEGFDRELLRKVKSFLLLEGIGGTECTC
jgi:competence ComEA-like helix-hairpin-helix protein